VITEDAVLVRFPEASELEANRAAVLLADELRRRPGVRDAIPGARSLAIFFDPDVVSGDSLARFCERPPEPSEGPEPKRLAGHVRRIPVLYGGDAGPDLEPLARERGMSADEFARRHAAGRYEVAFLGFAPGFAYLTGLSPELAAPRLDTPRTRVPAGSVAIGGPYTGVYPAESPGGWRLIGRTAFRLFDPTAVPPTLLTPGHTVRFEAVGPEEFDRLRAVREAEDSADAPRDRAGAVARIRTPGVWTTVQGAPRANLARWGIPPGGALDEEALAAGNAMLGNARGAAALEMSFVGPELEWLAPAFVCVSGAAVEAEVGGRRMSQDRPFRVEAGAILRVGRLSGGARAYLCVGGGFAPEKAPRASVRLAAGDRVFAPSALTESRPGGGASGRPVLPASETAVVRVVLGPDEDRFTSEGLATLLSSAFRVSAASDRRGIRLEGPPVAHSGAPDVPPEGTPLGGIQVARDGQPIVLGPDRPVTGGYARIATVLKADFPMIGRALPGSMVRFRLVSLAAAIEAGSKLSPPAG
jgi:KipI family sensor histidine kinase inhibitor